ncbi:Type II secretion system F domain protein [Halosimplex carlsbadense 2-9-1]|uniref:Type II secretion system F domain protein n=1 Tax=Halosimplex carlsbadense 2-9-1 TaxID=797114 RepID=M0D478_9EURY|nr:type II secretion system F family protein [Halosimplex carlsbadense]ELZ30250.1 Type II secretion system F domain protein [Halosimplex carlsbadense 2-9-1]
MSGPGERERGTATESEGETTTERESETTADDAPFRGAGVDPETAETVIADALEEPVGEPLDPASGDAEAARERRGDPGPPEEVERRPEPETALGSGLEAGHAARESEREELREAYGYVRAFFKRRPDRYQRLARRLKQARIGVTYDEYLVTSTYVAALCGVVGLLVGLCGVVAWTAFGAQSGAAAGSGLAAVLSGALAATAWPVLVGAAVAGAVLGAGCGWVGRNYYYPRRVVAARRREIALTLPYAITYTYALTSGGMTFLAVCRRLAAADAVYGEVANEFDVVVREVDLFGNDLPTALGNARTLTPSDPLQRFFDDLLSVLESGGDLEAFLEGESREYLDEAMDEQTAFIETLGTLSEVFVVAFVAAPLFLIVVMLVVSSLGADTVGQVALLVYLGFPLAMLGFLLLIDLLSAPYEQPAVARSADGARPTPDAGDDDRYADYERSARRQRLRELVTRPAAIIRRRPGASLALTVPLGVGVAVLAVALGVVTPSVEAVLAAPVRTTAGLAVAPLLVATVPLAALHERERRRSLTVTERFPDVLGILASANRMGIDVVDGFDLVVRWTSGTLADELRTVRNDVAWNHDLPSALLSFADRVRVPGLTRTVRLIADGSRTTGDLHKLLEVAATDTRARAKVRRARRRAVGTYVAIVVLGFLVYLLVVVLLSRSYLAPLAAVPELPESTVTTGLPLGGSVPVDVFEVLFFHSALVQGFGSGLLAGKLAENDVRSGLKYGIGLVLLTVATFALLV